MGEQNTQNIEKLNYVFTTKKKWKIHRKYEINWKKNSEFFLSRPKKLKNNFEKMVENVEKMAEIIFKKSRKNWKKL